MKNTKQKKDTKRNESRFNDGRQRKLEPQGARRTERQNFRHAYGV